MPKTKAVPIIPVDQRQPFLDAIAAAPNDNLPKLVFADFLDERGDGNGAARLRRLAKCRRLTLELAKTLKPGDYLYNDRNRNAKGQCQRWCVNGQVKRWKKDAGRIYVPLKHGLYAHGSLRESDFGTDGVCIHQLYVDCPDVD